MAVHFDSGDGLIRTTGVTIGTSTSFAALGWVKVDGYGVGDFIQFFNLTTAGSAPMFGTDTDETGTNSIDAFVWTAGFGTSDIVQLVAGGSTGWHCICVRHVGGTSDYEVYVRDEDDTSFTLAGTLNVGVELTFNEVQIAQSAFSDPTNTDQCSFHLIIGSAPSASALFDISEDLDHDGSANNTDLRMAAAASAGTNAGTAGNYTVNGTPVDEAVEPDVGGGGGPSTDQIPLATAVTAPRPRPLAAKRFDAVAPVGALIVAGLSSIGWGPSTPLPPRPRPNKPVQQPVAPVGTGTFALPKFAHSASTPLPPRGQRPNPPALQPSAPVGTLLTPAPSLGWLQIDASPPRQRRMFVVSSTGDDSSPLPRAWFDEGPREPVRKQPPARRVEPAQPVGTAFAASGLTSLGWLLCDPPPRSALATVRRDSDARQPTGPLRPFVSTSTGWFPAELPAHLPVTARQVAASSPVGFLLTPQPFGWYAEHQARPAPVVPRRVEPAAPVGTPFAIALPSNGWLATDNPRTPLRIKRAVVVDPVGSPLGAQTLPTIGWLATDNPRTPYRSQRAVVVDPVGDRFLPPPALGPTWFVEQGRAAPVPARRPQPWNPERALEQGLVGSPWADLTSSPARVARGRTAEPSAPIGTAFSDPSPSFGWAPVELPRQRLNSSPRPAVHEPVGAPIVTELPSIGWLATEGPRGRWYAGRVAPAEPVGSLIPPPPPSAGVEWMLAVELPPRALAPNRQALLMASESVVPLAPVVAPVEGSFLVLSVTHVGLVFRVVNIEEV